MYVQEDRLETLFDLPVQLPQTLIPAAGWLAVATIQVPDGAILDLRWLQLYVATSENNNSTDPCGTSGQNTINPDYLPGSLVSLFLIKDWAPNSEPWTQTIIDQLLAPADFNLAPTAIPPIISVRSLTTPVTVTQAGIYTFVVLNNTTNRKLSVTVDGAITMDADAIMVVTPVEPAPPIPPVPSGSSPAILISNEDETGVLSFSTSFGGPIDRQFTITNVGDGDLVVSAVNYPDISPSLTTDDQSYPVTISPGNTLTITATLTPNDSSGDPLSFDGTLNVTSNAVSGDNTFGYHADDIWVS
jgi:hypothetical protein